MADRAFSRRCGRAVPLAVLAALVLSLDAAAAPPLRDDSPLPPDSEIQKIVDDRVVTYRDSVGLVVGIIDAGGRKFFTRGTYDIGDDTPVDQDTIFEIGAVTKVFTALALTDMAQRGELSLTDPVAKYLPADAKLPERGGRSISLLDLATHTSGLPKRPSNVLIDDPNRPNRDFTPEQLYRYLATVELNHDIGSAYEYSDLGYALLGQALTDREKTDYETLIRARVTGPLHMDNTRLAPAAAEKEHLTVGHNEHLQPVRGAPPPAMPGYTGMRSTAGDLLNLLAVGLGFSQSPLSPATAEMVRSRHSTGFAELDSAIGWHIATTHDVQMIWHNGQANGCRAFIGYSPTTKIGVVVLSNADNIIDDIGGHLLDPALPLRKLHREVAINPTIFGNYVGRYEVDQNFWVTVTVDGSKLYIQPAGQDRAELFAEGSDKFFLRVADAEVTFQTDETGRAHTVVLSQEGKIVSARRVR